LSEKQDSQTTSKKENKKEGNKDGKKDDESWKDVTKRFDIYATYRDP
jgi:hypothetical protein